MINAQGIEAEVTGGGIIDGGVSNNNSIQASLNNGIMEVNTGKYIAGENIEIVDNVISVTTTGSVEEDNTKPITSAAVYTEVGNINILLQTI